MAEIQQLKNIDTGDKIYPVTHTKAVYNSSNKSLETILGEIDNKIPSKVSELENDSKFITDISGKQDITSDLATIRSNAKKGLTAIQPEDLAEYIKRDEIDSLIEDKINSKINNLLNTPI